MITCTVMPSGALKITAGNETRRYIAERQRAGEGFYSIFAGLFEPYFTNGGYELFDAGQANPFVGLTDAPCIAESLTVNDDGSREIDGRLWYFANYMLRDPLDELKSRGRVTFQSGD